MKKVKILNNIFTIRTKGCEALVLNDEGFKYEVQILTQPNKDKKAIPVGKIMKVSKLDVEVI